MTCPQAKTMKISTPVEWGAATCPGRRSSNQDRFGTSQAEDLAVLVVCDGLGGHRGGAVAADLGVRRLLEGVAGMPRVRSMESLMLTISKEINDLGRSHGALEGLGTTLAALVIQGSRLCFAAVGDSRIFLLRQGRLGLLAEPHDLASILMREGVLSEEDVRSSPIRGRLTSYLGQEKPEVAAGSLTLRRGDCLALVSDGVLEGGEERLQGILARENAEDAARELVHGEPTDDNATAVVAHINSVERSCLAS